jgi:hypothetical protein
MTSGAMEVEIEIPLREHILLNGCVLALACSRFNPIDYALAFSNNPALNHTRRPIKHRMHTQQLGLLC